jgi:hypothetical protein
MTRVASGLASALGAALLTAAAPAAAGATGPVDSFRGSCQAQVVVSFDPPMSGSLKETQVSIATRWAACTGTVSRGGAAHRVDGAPTVGRLHASGPTSCQLSHTAGAGQFTIAHRWRIDFTYVEPRLGPFGALPYSGVAGGSALDFARLSRSEDPLDIATRCSGAGVPSVLVDVTVVTAPTISG